MSLRRKFVFGFFLATMVLDISHLTFAAQDPLKGSDPRFFIENKGQWPEEVKYLSRIGGMNAWITDFGVVYDYYRIERSTDRGEVARWPVMKGKERIPENMRIKGHVLRAVLDGANMAASAVGKGRREGYHNYFIGNDSERWASFVGLYDEIEIRDIYQGIHIRYYYDKGLLRYDYQVEAGADLSQIRFRMEGADGVAVNQDGELIIKTSLRDVTHGRLCAYQRDGASEQEVACRFEMRADGMVGIRACAYDQERALIIDPLVYSTFIGGASFDGSYGIALDKDGDACVTGYTNSSDYPTTSGAYDRSYEDRDIFVTRLKANGSGLVYSTFIGGASSDWGLSIVLDNIGNAYITGCTDSSDYPTTSGVYDRTYNGGFCDVFVTKLKVDGSGLLYSTFIGGSSGDFGYCITLDNSGNAYMTGYTTSSNYPTTSGVYDQIHNGVPDVFVTKLNADGSELVYSTFIGGWSSDQGFSIALDDIGNVSVSGVTYSEDYPATTGAYDQTNNGGGDVFISKLNADGSVLIYSTFIGGSDQEDQIGSIALDNDGNPYVTGGTHSSDYPTTSGAYDQDYDGEGDVFVTKLRADGSGLIYSSFIGGSHSDRCHAIGLDDGNAIVVGYTDSPNYPTTRGGYDQSFNYGEDAFITKLNSNGSGLLYSTFVGGSGDDLAECFALDETGGICLAGLTYSSNYPSTIGSYDQSFHGGYCDVFVTKLDLTSVPVEMISFQAAADLGCITLNWVTSSELNCQRWEIYRSDHEDDGYAKVGELPGHSATETPHTYHWVDQQVAVGVTYFYRLRQVDFDGSSWWSQVVSATVASAVPKTYPLYPNYPNPFNPMTQIHYQIPEDSHATLKVYNVKGQEVATLVDSDLKAGFYMATWDGRDVRRMEASAGIYFCTLKTSDVVRTIKMVLIR